jgi:hypothetical protein
VSSVGCATAVSEVDDQSDFIEWAVDPDIKTAAATTTTDATRRLTTFPPVSRIFVRLDYPVEPNLGVTSGDCEAFALRQIAGLSSCPVAQAALAS